ncbi:ATP-binding cassette domain-containing protein [Microbacterium ulmi]|uniref:ABC transporter ATP-binding protein n=1 Tax=Microbacterium ulmi TaxID=179095 RepID=A0A7Y2Q015_9MICO|nr:iron(III) transport system ATP-binding protein [Microbacterium ulmi]NNH03878.1 ABC transporter ATP-binding protein [Microbacterium ulmi]
MNPLVPESVTDAGTAVGEESAQRVVVSLRGLQKRFKRASGEWTAAVDGVSLDIHSGELVVLLGSSGCGKTTTLRCIAGLEQPTGGEVVAGGRVVSSSAGIVVPPEKRNFGMMFQSYAVWPHMSVFGNVAYPLKARKISKAQIEQRVGAVLDLVGIGHLRDEYPSQLSGGQQQRVALARCLVADPQVILFDEPLSNVDAKVREDLRAEILAMKTRIGFGGVYVTHDQEEALAIADRIAIMDAGRIVQIGTPREIYGRPNSLFVANFVGTINRLKGTVTITERGRVVVSTLLGDVVVTGDGIVERLIAGQDVWVVIRPEAIRLGDEALALENTWRGRIDQETFTGASGHVRVAVGDQSLRVRTDGGRQFDTGGDLAVGVAADRVRLLLPHDSDGAVR